MCRDNGENDEHKQKEMSRKFLFLPATLNKENERQYLKRIRIVSTGLYYLMMRIYIFEWY